MPAFAATQVFTGTEVLGPATVHVEQGLITHITPGGAPGARVLEGLLAPGLVDVQVNGGGGAMFNDAPTVATLRTITQAHAKLGVTSIMATLVSDDRSKTAAAIAAVEQAASEGLPGLLGLHLEGPWLSVPKRGVHPERFLRRLDAEDLKLIARKRPFPVLVTLAPEHASPDDVRTLVAAGVTVSIGHTAASHEEIETLLAAGATGFTHLFNAMPPLEGRKPGVLGSALASDAWTGLILDSIHVHPLSARVAFAAKTARRLMLVSDAMATVGSADPSMSLFGERIAVRDGALRTEAGALAGAHLDLAAAARNAVTMLHASREDALRMASLTPAEFLRVSLDRGQLTNGARADFALFDDALNVRNVWITGEPVA